MTFLPQLRDQLVAVPVKRSRRRAVHAVVATMTLGPLLTAGALAATGVIPVGSPVPAGPTPDPKRGGGAPVASSARLLPLRVEDPAGGPPWGLRLVETSRGLTCLQTGRVVDGQLGVLGQDSVAGNDGRFHPLPLTAGMPHCAAPDGAGNAFMGISMGTAASGPAPDSGCTVDDEPVPQRPPCPPQDERRVMFGLLGPEATAIVYRHQGRIHKQAVTGPEGAYLIVLASDQKRGGFSMGPMPAVGYTVRRIDYRDAPSCRGNRNRHPAQCPLVGYTPPRDAPTAESVRRPLRVSVKGDEIDVSFRAPVAITDARSYYALGVEYKDGGRRCRGRIFGIRTDRDLAKGARGHLTSRLLPNCRGRALGTVEYVPSDAASGPMGGGPPGAPGHLLVGRFSVKLP